VLDTVRLQWEGVYNLERVDEYSGLDYTMGLYSILDSQFNSITQTWWSHRLLYIGKVYDQTFAERLKQHLAGDDVWRWIRKNLRYHATSKVGHVDLMGRERISFELVSDIESLLINFLKPPGNVKSRVDYYGRTLLVLNGGKYHPLPERISTDDIE
jgi:hypothetical protein